MNEISMYILEGFLLIFLGVVTKFFIPYLKTQATASNLACVKLWIDALVKAAEQTIHGSKMGTEKKAWVIKILKSVGIKIDETVDALIEAAVYALNSAINKADEDIKKAIENESED